MTGNGLPTYDNGIFVEKNNSSRLYITRLTIFPSLSSPTDFSTEASFIIMAVYTGKKGIFRMEWHEKFNMKAKGLHQPDPFAKMMRRNEICTIEMGLRP